jgi:hypothetical protein
MSRLETLLLRLHSLSRLLTISMPDISTILEELRLFSLSIRKLRPDSFKHLEKVQRLELLVSDHKL